MRYILATFALVACAAAQSGHNACKDSPKVVGPCYEVRGVLFYANGGPSTRIAIPGTKRILGVVDEEEGMPEYISKLMRNFNDEVHGVFLVCPYAKERPGHMRPVRIESGKNLIHRVNNSH